MDTTCRRMTTLHYFVLLIAGSSIVVHASSKTDVYACDSRIYCQGELLRLVQTSKLFDDDKTFVDRPMIQHEDIILEDFDKLYAHFNGDIPKENLTQFVEEHFHDADQEMDVIMPDDFVKRPYVFYKIRDVELRFWANELNILWKKLTRKISPPGERNNGSSIIYVPNKLVVPGGRFREFYYWDTYWIIRGLLISEMTSTARGMIENLLDVVERYGFVPNGGRIYYTRRSQPPFLTLMMHSYYAATHDVTFVQQHIATLEKEYEFWRDERTVVVTHANNRTDGLARYKAGSNTPRPEGYAHDIAAARHIKNDIADVCDASNDGVSSSSCRSAETQRQEFFTNIASAAESGWDFSTRWFADQHHMKSIKTQDIIPVDLNAFLCATERLLAKLYHAIGDQAKSSTYQRSFEVRRHAMHKLLYSSKLGMWFDYDVELKRHRKSYYISNFTPLFAQCYDKKDKKLLEKIWYYINDTQVLKYKGGVPTSLATKTHQQQQWDYPNAWPPSVHMLIEGLADTKSKRLQEMAFQIAQTWISANFKGWEVDKAMYEKYDANHAGQRGAGGEYTVQTGFGWTNGVILVLLDTYGNRLKAVAGRDTLLGLTLEAFVCVVTVLLILGLILAGTCVYWRKKRQFEKRRGLVTSRDDVQYAAVNTSAVSSSHDNHHDNRANELLEKTS